VQILQLSNFVIEAVDLKVRAARSSGISPRRAGQAQFR
jgi:hypothetical protein